MIAKLLLFITIITGTVDTVQLLYTFIHNMYTYRMYIVFIISALLVVGYMFSR